MKEVEDAKKDQKDLIKEKELNMQLELKLSELESENLNKDLEKREAELKANNFELRLQSLKVTSTFLKTTNHEEI